MSTLRINLLTSSSHELVPILPFTILKSLMNKIEAFNLEEQQTCNRLISAGPFCFHVAFIIEMADIINSSLYCSVIWREVLLQESDFS